MHEHDFLYFYQSHLHTLECCSTPTWCSHQRQNTMGDSWSSIVNQKSRQCLRSISFINLHRMKWKPFKMALTRGFRQKFCWAATVPTGNWEKITQALHHCSPQLVWWQHINFWMFLQLLLMRLHQTMDTRMNAFHFILIFSNYRDQCTQWRKETVFRPFYDIHLCIHSSKLRHIIHRYKNYTELSFFNRGSRSKPWLVQLMQDFPVSVTLYLVPKYSFPRTVRLHSIKSIRQQSVCCYTSMPIVLESRNHQGNSFTQSRTIALRQLLLGWKPIAGPITCQSEASEPFIVRGVGAWAVVQSKKLGSVECAPFLASDRDGRVERLSRSRVCWNVHQRPHFWRTAKCYSAYPIIIHWSIDLP